MLPYPTLGAKEKCIFLLCFLRFEISANISGGCTLQFNENYKIFDLQIKQPNLQDWVKVSELTHIKDGMIEVHELPFGSRHKFRGLAKTQDERVVCLTTQQCVIIRGIFQCFLSNFSLAFFNLKIIHSLS